LKTLIKNHVEDNEAYISHYGHTIQVDLKPLNETWDVKYKGDRHKVNLLKGGYLNGEEYYLAQIHFHYLSEHTVNGGRYLLEAHLVHVNLDKTKHGTEKELAVVGVFYKEGESNTWLKQFTDHLESPTFKKGWNEQHGNPWTAVNKTGPHVQLQSIDLHKVLDDKGDWSKMKYWAYKGSLTTPPCSEKVTWHVMQHIQTASAQELEVFRNVLGMKGNARPIQKLNGRNIWTNNKDMYQKPHKVCKTHGFVIPCEQYYPAKTLSSATGLKVSVHGVVFSMMMTFSLLF